MEIYKAAAKQRLRFKTGQGELSVEQLFQLSIGELDALAVSLDEAHNQSAKKSFVIKKTGKDKTAKLRFDIVIDVLNTKVEAAAAAAERQEIKEHNNKIIAAISEKQEGELKNKSLKQLQGMLRETSEIED